MLHIKNIKYILVVLLLFIVFKFGIENKQLDPELILNEHYIIKYRDSVHDTVNFMYFAFPNKIEYKKGDTIKHIQSWNYTLDTITIITFKFNNDE